MLWSSKDGYHKILDASVHQVTAWSVQGIMLMELTEAH